VRAALAGTPGAAAHLSEVAPVVLGIAALRTLAGSFAVTPLQTLFGWKWHLVLRRDLGRWAFAFAAIDLVIAAADTTGGAGGPGAVNGVAGHLFLSLGTLATLLLVPLALTSNRWSMRRLGRYWKRLHLLVYAILAVIVVHLLLLPDGPSSTVQMSWLFGPSLVLRIPVVRRWIVRRRTAWQRRRRERDRVAVVA
jgi:sulfoxide reductase heme-binding subunit YedZ